MIDFDNSADLGNTSGTSLTSSFTCSGVNRFLWVGVTGSTILSDITGVTYAGVAMTLVGAIQIPGGSRFLYLFGLANPTSGANNVIISAGTSTFIGATAQSYTGSQQITTPDAIGTNTASSATTISKSITTVLDKCWLVSYQRTASNDGGTVAGANTTLRVNTASDGMMGDSNGAETPAGPFGQAYSWVNSNDTAIIVASFAPASNAGGMFLANFM